jgi:sodium-dependent phosphate cotransporter
MSCSAFSRRRPAGSNTASVRDSMTPGVPASAPKGLQAVEEESSRAVRLGRLLALAVLLYVFLCSIELLGGTFKLMGKGFAEALVTSTSNPFSGLLIGTLATSLVQSSSTVTSLVVGLVAGGVLSVTAAVPIVMGANIGTSITNTIVAMGHITRAQEFQRAFAGATVHDFFNLMTVAVFLPLEITTHFLSKSAEVAERLLVGREGVEFHSPLKAIVEPVSRQIQHWIQSAIDVKTVAVAVLLVVALAMLAFSLRYIVVVMKRVVLGKVEVILHRYVFRHPLRGIVLGTIITILVQSSSVTTSLTVPLLAAGLVSVEQIFPFILGANVGTTITALLASMVTGSSAALAVALCHVFFNVFGILVFYPLRRLPIAAARWLGRLTLRSKLYALGYVAVVFFLIPGAFILITR